LAPCDFYLFCYIKGRLAGASFEEPNQLLRAIDATLRSIEDARLERVFQEWMNRLAECCVAVGGSIEGTSKGLKMIQVLLDQFPDVTCAPDILYFLVAILPSR
jgi:hypothetical protein